MTLGQKLRLMLDERNITQKQLALELNMAPSTLGGYIQDVSEPDYATLKLLARYFNVTTDYLLDYHYNKNYGSEFDELIRIFNALTEEQKELYIEQGKAFIRFNSKRDVKSSKSILKKNNIG